MAINMQLLKQETGRIHQWIRPVNCDITHSDPDVR